MNEENFIESWKKANLAQLKFYKKNMPKTLSLGNCNYIIYSYGLNEHNVPILYLSNIKTNVTESCSLQAVWEGFVNFSTLDEQGRKELLKQYNIE